MRVVIFNTVAYNGGDALILEVSAELLREALGAATQFTVYDKDGAVPGRYHPDLAFRPSLIRVRPTDPVRRHLGRRVARMVTLGRLRAGLWALRHGVPLLATQLLSREQLVAVREYLNADLLVSTGGTYLVEHYDLGRALDELRFALQFGAPVVLFPQSMGPFTTPAHRRAVRRVLERTRLVLLRDEQSLRHLEPLGLRRCLVQVVADPAFALASPSPGPPRPAPRGNGLSVAISVRPWPGWLPDPPSGATRYRAALGELVSHLVERHGARVTFVSTCQGIPEYWADDSRIATEIEEGLPRRIRASVSVDRDRHTTHELMLLLAAQTLVVATRLHAAILAMVAGTPVLPIAYEFKTDALFDRLGLGMWVQDIRSLDGRELCRVADQFIASLPAIRRQLTEAIPAERTRARRCIDLVREIINEATQPTHSRRARA